VIEKSDTYKTIKKPFGEVLFKDKGSKFIGYVYPIHSEEEVKGLVIELKKKHHAARHWCYAWRLGVSEERYRVNDDGEPNNSAGKPIYGQLVSKDLTNVLLIVVRYFGGVKLGVGGLINAYKTTAKMTLEEANIVQKSLKTTFHIVFEYQNMEKIHRIIKENDLNILDQKMELNCEFVLEVRQKFASKIKQKLEELRCVGFKDVKT